MSIDWDKYEEYRTNDRLTAAQYDLHKKKDPADETYSFDDSCSLTIHFTKEGEILDWSPFTQSSVAD